jgi:hypothetical protein
MRNKESWLRVLREADKAMMRDNLTEYEIPVETVHMAGVDGGYPTIKSQEDVAAQFNLVLDFGPSWIEKCTEPPPIKPMCKLRRRNK